MNLAKYKLNQGDGLFWIGITTVGLAVPEETEKDYMVIRRRLLPHGNRLSQSLHKVHVVGKCPQDTSHLIGLHNLGNLYGGQAKIVGAGPCRCQKGASDYPYLGGLAAGSLSEKLFARSIMSHRTSTLANQFYST
jgi:hypothetical protein